MFGMFLSETVYLPFDWRGLVIAIPGLNSQSRDPKLRNV